MIHGPKPAAVHSVLHLVAPSFTEATHEKLAYSDTVPDMVAPVCTSECHSNTHNKVNSVTCSILYISCQYSVRVMLPRTPSPALALMETWFHLYTSGFRRHRWSGQLGEENLFEEDSVMLRAL